MIELIRHEIKDKFLRVRTARLTVLLPLPTSSLKATLVMVAIAPAARAVTQAQKQSSHYLANVCSLGYCTSAGRVRAEQECPGDAISTLRQGHSLSGDGALSRRKAKVAQIEVAIEIRRQIH